MESLHKSGKPKVRLSSLVTFQNTESCISGNKIHTICESGLCPNKRECWGRGTATFMILGDICTRACKFCGVKTGKPFPPDIKEQILIADTIKNLKLKHVVLTSVDRDDLPDYGAQFWIDTIKTIRTQNNGITIETLIPDFNGNTALLDLFVQCKPEIVSHNIETVKSLTPVVRSVATYERSLFVLNYLSKRNVHTKSGLMLGLGEQESEVYQTLNDLRENDCKIVTIGQYYQPSKSHFPVKEMIQPYMFDKYKDYAMKLGFSFVESGPLVRSSYHAEMQIKVS